MAHSVGSSYVKIWVWESVEKNAQAAPVYGHVALETVHRGHSTYISFCVDLHCKLKPSATLNGYPAHFHEEKEQDNAIQTGKKSRFYQLFCLDVSKINNAFEQFRKNPNAWGSLGWGIFDRAYHFNGCGLTAFLLDKGKIFSDPIYQNAMEVNSLTQRVIIGFSAFYSAVNGWVGYQCRSFMQQIIVPNQEIMLHATSNKILTDTMKHTQASLDHAIKKLELVTQFTGLANEIELVAKSNNMKFRPADQLKLEQLRQLTKLLEPVPKFLANFKKVRKTVDRIQVTGSHFEAYPWQEKYVTVQKFTDSVSYISKRLFGVAAITMAALAIFQCVNNRINGWYDARDIVLLSEKAMYAEWQYAMKTQGPLNLAQEDSSMQG